MPGPSSAPCRALPQTGRHGRRGVQARQLPVVSPMHTRTWRRKWKPDGASEGADHQIRLTELPYASTAVRRRACGRVQALF